MDGLEGLVQVITNDCEKVFEVPCHRCGTNQLHSQMKKVECGDKQRCDEARESLLDDAACVSPGGNSSTALRRKRPTEAIQTQTQKPSGGNGNRVSGQPKLLACQTKVADATDMDIDVVSDQAQHSNANTESIGLGAEAEPGEVSASGGETLVTANRQRSPIDAYKANRTPRQMESYKRQKLSLVGSQSPTHCLRCKTVKYCTDTCKKLHWMQGHGKTCTPDNAGCPSCGEEVNIAHVRDARRWCTARIDASTLTSTATCTNAPWCCLKYSMTTVNRWPQERGQIGYRPQP